MVKKCPSCNSERITFAHSYSGNWKCKDCGYVGVIILEEDDNT